MFKSVQHLDGYRIGGIHSGLFNVISCVAIAHHVTLLHSYIYDRLIFLFGAPESNFPAHLIVAIAIAEQTRAWSPAMSVAARDSHLSAAPAAAEVLLQRPRPKTQT